MYQGVADVEIGELTSQREAEGDGCGGVVVVPLCAFLVAYMVILSVWVNLGCCFGVVEYWVNCCGLGVVFCGDFLG